MARNNLAMIQIGAHVRRSPIRPTAASGPSQKSDTENRGELSRLVIETAENGFSCEAQFEPDEQPTDKNGLPYPDSELMVFTDLKSLFSYQEKVLTEQVAYENAEK